LSFSLNKYILVLVNFL